MICGWEGWSNYQVTTDSMVVCKTVFQFFPKYFRESTLNLVSNGFGGAWFGDATQMMKIIDIASDGAVWPLQGPFSSIAGGDEFREIRTEFYNMGHASAT